MGIHCRDYSNISKNSSQYEQKTSELLCYLVTFLSRKAGREKKFNRQWHDHVAEILVWYFIHLYAILVTNLSRCPLTLPLIPTGNPTALAVYFSLRSRPPSNAVSSAHWLHAWLWISIYALVLDGLSPYKNFGPPFNRPSSYSYRISSTFLTRKSRREKWFSRRWHDHVSERFFYFIHFYNLLIISVLMVLDLIIKLFIKCDNLQNLLLL